MGYNIVFTDEALKDLDSFDKKIIKRIVKKLRWFSKQDNPINFAKALKYEEIGQYRFRIGDYRVVFDLKKEKIKVLRIGHRSTIYK